MNRSAFLLISFLLVWTSGAPGQETPAHRDNVKIVVADSADAVVRFAAQDLARYLRQISGRAIPIGGANARHVVFVGHIPQGLSSEAGRKLHDDLAGIKQDGFIIRTAGPNLVIVGKGPRGTLYGCYAFLERLGARWYFPGAQHEVLPRKNLDWRTPIDVVESPSFEKRILFYWPHNYTRVVDWIDFSAKARLNRIMFHYTWPARDWYIDLRPTLLPELEKRGMEVEAAGHFLASFLPRTLFPEHPDWFRRNDQGQRVNDFNLNPFNADALDYLLSGAVKHLLQMPEAVLFHLWADDIGGGGWSHEPGKEAYTPSDQALLVSNALAQRLRQSLPKANVAFLAYHDTVLPPQVVKPEPGVIFFYAPRERCYAHALNDSACSLNQKYAQALEQALPSFGSAQAEVFEYYVDQILYENLTNPPMPDVLSADAAYYGQLGIPAVGALMTNTSDFVTPMVNMFLYPQALWNSRRDLAASLAEYARLYFGDPTLSTYFRALDLGFKDVLKICRYEQPGSAWDSTRPERESDAALAYRVQGLKDGIRGPLARADSQLAAAIQRSKNSTFRRRLEAEQTSLEFSLIQAKLFYHLLKGERQYREWKRTGDAKAGLEVLAQTVLARYMWEKQKRLVARARIQGSPLIPEPRILEERSGELTGLVYRDAARAVGINPWGYSVDPLVQHLEDGVSGAIVAGPTGSKAILWTDLDSPAGRPPEPGGLIWADEFGQPLESHRRTYSAEPVVVDAKGIAADQLFRKLAAKP